MSKSSTAPSSWPRLGQGCHGLFLDHRLGPVPKRRADYYRGGPCVLEERRNRPLLCGAVHWEMQARKELDNGAPPGH